VDENVTRHLDEELERDDWDVMILHYLGLDHIGHLEGGWRGDDWEVMILHYLGLDNIGHLDGG
jgi:predicted AlkP superfamily pyrophosphatase or phosphodiesterase